MLLGRNFTADDFEQEPRGPRFVDSWRARIPLDNPLGPFDVMLNTPPDAELLGHVNRIAAAVSNEYDAILNLIYDHYLRAAEDKDWMKSCGVPRRLREDRVKRYVRNRSISVHRDRRGAVNADVFIRPLWEPEHRLHLVVVNDKFVALRC